MARETDIRLVVSAIWEGGALFIGITAAKLIKLVL